MPGKASPFSAEQRIWMVTKFRKKTLFTYGQMAPELLERFAKFQNQQTRESPGVRFAL